MTLRLGNLTRRVGAEADPWHKLPDPDGFGAVRHVDTLSRARDKLQPRKWETEQWEALR
jgi:hypothetical protein